ncbi:hypothetical protein OAK47_01850 [Planctomycetaceae bacterium]|jgi:hypothetical protein|nr:hypothetical protein [Planctomycetaceae bacterium]
MKSMRTLFVVFGSLFVVSLLTGCQRMMYELHPERLWRLNRGPAVGQIDPNFSISDDEATAKSEELSRLFQPTPEFK